ncbi:hypothetical protein GCM10010522_14670 [Kribbella solani]
MASRGSGHRKVSAYVAPIVQISDGPDRRGGRRFPAAAGHRGRRSTTTAGRSRIDWSADARYEQ